MICSKRTGIFSVGNSTSSTRENVLESLFVFTHVRVPFREPDPAVDEHKSEMRGTTG